MNSEKQEIGEVGSIKRKRRLEKRSSVRSERQDVGGAKKREKAEQFRKGGEAA